VIDRVYKIYKIENSLEICYVDFSPNASSEPIVPEYKPKIPGSRITPEITVLENISLELTIQ